MMEIRPLKHGVLIKYGDLKYKSKAVTVDEIRHLFKSFITFDEGKDWELKKNVLRIKHAVLADVVLVYLALRAAGLNSIKVRETVNKMRMFEYSSLATIMLYRLTAESEGYGRVLRRFGRAIATAYC